eukprot:560327-Pleurochrysis_carterae.AAC.2
MFGRSGILSRPRRPGGLSSTGRRGLRYRRGSRKRGGGENGLRRTVGTGDGHLGAGSRLKAAKSNVGHCLRETSANRAAESEMGWHWNEPP